MCRGFAVIGMLLAQCAIGGEAVPVMLPERLDVGNVNIRVVQPIDEAAWIWSDGKGSIRVFRNRFVSGAETVRIHVSADQRYVLKLDGRRIARGPERGTVERWTYRTLDLHLEAGEHLLEAVVQRLPFGDKQAPHAQLCWWQTPGFVLRAEGRLDGVLTTGRGGWKARDFCNVTIGRELAETFGIGGSNVIDGCSPWFLKGDDAGFGPVKVVREPVAGNPYGVYTRGWRLYPTSLPLQYERTLTPGEFKAATSDLAKEHVYTKADAASSEKGRFAALLRGEEVAVPANSSVCLLWDLGNYYCAYPELETSGGNGARVEFGWAESPRGKLGKGDRAECVGKSVDVFNDVFLPDGGDDGFSTTWWRAGRWVRLVVKTAETPLTIRRLAISEVHYPMDFTHSFVCDDTTLEPVIAICERAMQMCSHEMGFDCPFYEQQMYTGDTRLQLLIQGVTFGDDRLIRRDLELFDCSRRQDGMVAFNFPTSWPQEGYSYSVIWPMMIGDYAMWHDNPAWLRQRFPGVVHTMEGCRNFVNGDGLVANPRGWNFQDWTTWQKGGDPGCDPHSNGTNCFNNLLYAYALKASAAVAEALGETGYAALYRERFERSAAAIRRAFWCEERGMVADDLAKTSFSEHNLSMSLLTDILPKDLAARTATNLIAATDLVPTTVYFSHYLFDAYAKIGRADLILGRLDLWRGYVANHLKTTPEQPEKDDGTLVSRSDCHAWGAHPLFHLHASILGIRPVAPRFARVRIAPQPGTLRHITATTPTPKGNIRCDLSFSDGSIAGTIELPDGLSGEMIWQGRSRPLRPGTNSFD